MIIRKASKTALLTDQNTAGRRHVIAHDRPNPAADRLLARRDDAPQQGARLPAGPGHDILRQVSGMVADLPELPRPDSTHVTATASANTSA
jgi:hypothetical protein